MTEFNGFAQPEENWSKLPHQFIHMLPLIDTIAEMKVILYVLRHTWGYQDDWKCISIDEFINGRIKKDKERLDQGTGLSKQSVITGLKKAVQHGFLVVNTDDSDAGRIKKSYSLNVAPRVSNVSEADVKTLDPPVQIVDSNGLNLGHRTEKETLETNLKKEKGPPDYLDMVMDHQAGQETVAQPDNFQQHFGYRDQFLQIYNQLTGQTLTQAEKGVVVELAGQARASPQVWRQSIEAAILNWSGHRKLPPLQRIIDVYQAGGDYQAFRAKQWPDQEDAVPKPTIPEFVRRAGV